MATTRSRLIERETGVEGEAMVDAEARVEGQASARGDVGPTALGVSLGIQVLLAGLLFVPTPGRPALTTIGDIGFKPEWDGMLFVVGGALGVALAAVFCLVRGRWRRLPRVGAPAQVAIAVAGVAISLACFRFGRRYLIAGDPVSRAYLLVLLSLMAATAVVGLLSRPAPDVRASSGKARLPFGKARLSSEEAQAGRRRVRSWPLDWLIAIAIVAVFYQPGSRLLAGQTLQLDSMLHWDYFAMGPTLAYHAGAALGTDVHVFYGVGWPVLFSSLSSIISISYAHMIVVAQIAGCACLIGAYAFLRLLLRDVLWAVTGVVLVLVFGVFARSAAPFAPYWGFPSLSLVRCTFDAWFFAALVLSLRSSGLRSSGLRSSGRRWDFVAGALVGLAILFELDTGFYLAAAMGFFWLCRGAASPDRREVGRRAATATAAGAVVLFAGLAVASRGTLVHPDFWPGWLENLRATSAGVSMEPLTTGTPPWTIVVLVLMMAVYLAVVSHALVGAIRGRISTDALVLGTLAGYGFLITLYFLGRSTPYNLVRCTAPFALLLAALGSRACALGAARLQGRRNGIPSPWFSRGPAVVALGLSLVLLVQNPVFRAHRGLARVVIGGRHPEGVCKFDFCGLGPDWSTNLDRVRVVAGRLHQLAPNGEKVAVLDQTGPLFHLLSGTAPWGRYTPLLISLYNPERLESVIDSLESDPPAVAVIRTADSPLFDDTLTPLRAVVRDHFDLDSELEGYQIWRLRAGAPTG